MVEQDVPIPAEHSSARLPTQEIALRRAVCASECLRACVPACLRACVPA